MGCHFLLQGIFLNQESNLSFLHWQADSLPLSHQGSPPICILCSSSGVLIFFQSIFKNFHKFCFAIFVANSFQFNEVFFRTKGKYIYAPISQFLTKCLNIVIAISLHQFVFFFLTFHFILGYSQVDSRGTQPYIYMCLFSPLSPPIQAAM